MGTHTNLPGIAERSDNVGTTYVTSISTIGPNLPTKKMH